jgi:hypothetical protein
MENYSLGIFCVHGFKPAPLSAIAADSDSSYLWPIIRGRDGDEVAALIVKTAIFAALYDFAKPA